MLRVERFHWPTGIEDKVHRKHGLDRDELEESFFHRLGKLRRSGERYRLFTRTDSGDYIVVIFELAARTATIVSARDMTASERRFFRRK